MAIQETGMRIYLMKLLSQQKLDFTLLRRQFVIKIWKLT